MSIDALAETIDRALAKPLIALALFLAVAAYHALAGTDLGNIAISYLTFALLLLMAGANRRDRKALHAKLDELLCVIPEARDELERLEDKAEREIEQLRR